ncbi:MAG: hypothetical protein KAK01_07425, partial [Candidatus Marinimicrobia bacterium]|nr:hypothetical protein [Candidatus Neomarinimicrobiota bacterium]
TLNYSYTNTGDWYSINSSDLGLNEGMRIVQIGNSQDYIWCRTSTLYVKCDHASGIMVGNMVNPDEIEISWSSYPLTPYDDISDILTGYSFFGNWNIFGSGLLNPSGEYVDITTYFRGHFKDFWIGTDNRVILLSKQQMNTFYPVLYGLNNTNVQFLLFDDGFWVGGRSNRGSNAGITFFSPGRQVYEHFDFKLMINMTPQSLYSAIDTEEEIWFGGEGQVLIYNKAQQYWRTLTGLDGVPRGKVITLAQDSTFVWMGASRGIGRISKALKKQNPTGFESLYDERFVNALTLFDDEIWIASDYHLRIFDITNNTISNYNEQKNTNLELNNLDAFQYYTAFTQAGENIYIGTTQGIIVYNSKSKETEILVNPTVYSGKVIKKMFVYDQYLWILTNKSIIRVKLNNMLVMVYNYDFMGTLNDLYITGDKLWIGTSEGLIKFYWQRDL